LILCTLPASNVNISTERRTAIENVVYIAPVFYADRKDRVFNGLSTGIKSYPGFMRGIVQLILIIVFSR
jgi:hypothetical protein